MQGGPATPTSSSGFLSNSLCITPPLPHFSHSDMFSPLLTVGDSQDGPDTSVMECIQFFGMRPEWGPSLRNIQQFRHDTSLVNHPLGAN